MDVDTQNLPENSTLKVDSHELDFNHLDTADAVFNDIFLLPIDKNAEGIKVNEYQEAINHPNHYLGERKYEPIDVINDWELNFQTGNAVKYISRAGRKDANKTIQDLEKAIWYLQWEVKKLKNYE